MNPPPRWRAVLALHLALLAGAAGAQPAWAPNPPNPNAPYPAESRDANEQGTVLLRVRTTPDGQPVEVRVHRSSGFARLDRSALETVKRWQFRPTPDDGAVVWREVPISFFITSPPPRPVLN
ncbi:MAG: energy transducer TonB [Rhodocyclaceae bacterium]|nr:energy transducer TonB [Rhodocyclaceae bacterium]